MQFNCLPTKVSNAQRPKWKEFCGSGKILKWIKTKKACSWDQPPAEIETQLWTELSEYTENAIKKRFPCTATSKFYTAKSNKAWIAHSETFMRQWVIWRQIQTTDRLASNMAQSCLLGERTLFLLCDISVFTFSDVTIKDYILYSWVIIFLCLYNHKVVLCDFDIDN